MKIKRADLTSAQRHLTQAYATYRTGDGAACLDALEKLGATVTRLKRDLRGELDVRALECGAVGPTTGEPCALPKGHSTVWHRTHGRSECWHVGRLCGQRVGSGAVRVPTGAEEMCPCSLLDGHEGPHEYDAARHSSARAWRLGTA